MFIWQDFLTNLNYWYNQKPIWQKKHISSQEDAIEEIIVANLNAN